VVLAGIGGREPLMNLARLSAQEPPGERLLVFSHHPVHGAFDSSRLGPRRGLYEPHLWRPRGLWGWFAADCSEPGAARLLGGVWFSCLPRLLSGCLHVYEGPGGGGPVAWCPKAGGEGVRA
jgi:hypothetical protein